MKKPNILKLTIVAGLLSIGTSAWAGQKDFFVKCTNYGSGSFGGYEFYIPGPYQGEPQIVKGRSQRSSETITTKATVSHFSWVSALAQFEFEGENFEIEFSTFHTPSLGAGEIDGESVDFACVIL